MTASTAELRALAASVRAGMPPPVEVLVVHAHLHPLKTESSIVIVPVGSTVQQIVDACASQANVSGMASQAVVRLNGEPVPAKAWRLIRPKATAHVHVQALPGDFIITPIVAGLANTLGLGAFGQAVLGALVSAGLSFLANALFAPSPAEAEQQKQVYSIAGARNEVSKWGPIPQVLGNVRVSAKYAAAPYTTFEGDDQYVTMLLVWSIGPVDVSSIKIGETPISRFKDVEIQTFEGYSSDDKQTLYPREIVQDDLNITTSKSNGPHLRTSADDSYQFVLDFQAPGGLYEQKNEGPDEQNVDLKIEYRQVGTPSWTVFRSKYQLKGDSSDPIRRSVTIKPKADDPSFTSGQIEVRVTQLTSDHDDNDNIIVDNVVWSSLKSYRRSPPIEKLPPLALTALRIRATDQLNGTPDDINAEVCTKGKHWTGESWINDSRINNPADLFRHVLQGRANKKPVANSKIDLTTLQSWHNYCDNRDFRFNMNRDFRASVWETLRDVCAAGRGMPVFRDGKWSVAWEQTKAPVVQHFTPRNSWGFKREQGYRELPDALRCKFLNQEKGWIEDELLVAPYGQNPKNALTTKQVEFPGITDPILIKKHARYRMAEAKLRPAKMTVMVDFEHLVCTLGDRVACSHDVLMNAQVVGARVVDVQGQVVTLDQEVARVSGQDYGLRFRRAVTSTSGRSVVRQTAGANGVSNYFTLVGSGTVPAIGDLCSFGPLGQEAGIYRIKRISPADELTAEVEMVDDAPEIEDADSDELPDYDSGIVKPVDLTAFPPKRLRVKETKVKVKGRLVSRTTLTWDVVSLAEILFFEVTGTDPKGKKQTWRTKDGRTQLLQIDNLRAGRWKWKVKSCFRNSRRNRTSVELREAS